MTATPEQEEMCKRILKTKDYYDILGVNKETTDEDIRRSYKKLAVRTHPDKNKSKNANEAFKKVNHAFTVLSDKEKRDIFDKYGTDEDIQAKMQQRQGRQQFNQDDMDAFDIFNMFFTGGQEGAFHFQNGQGRGFGNMNMHNQQQQRRRHNNNNEGEDNARPRGLGALVYQFLPFILMWILMGGFGSIFTSVSIHYFLIYFYISIFRLLFGAFTVMKYTI